MDTSFSPQRYRAALLDHFNASSSPVTEARGSASRRGLRIENSSLLGNHFYDLNASRHAHPTSRIPRSIVIDFIDQCVTNRVPETVIVEHVLFMVRAMQGQISMTEALHAQYHQDRLRDYEMSELTNMLERQQVFYEEARSTTARPRVHVDHKDFRNENSRNIQQSASAQRERGTACARVNMSSHYDTSAVTAIGREPLRQSALLHNQSSRTMLTQKPTNGTATHEAKKACNGSHYAHEKSAPHPRMRSVLRSDSIQRLVRATQASSGKERQKYNAESAKEAPPSAVRRTAAVNRNRTNDLAALRGRRRLVTETVSLRGNNITADVSTWSDEEKDSLPSSVSSLSPQPVLRGVQGKQKEEQVVEESHSTSFIPPSSLDWQSADVPAPPLSVGVPSKTTASLRLRAYIDHSERKIRESERLLASTPSGKLQRQRSVSFSPLSGEVSELSDD